MGGICVLWISTAAIYGVLPVLGLGLSLGWASAIGLVITVFALVEIRNDDRRQLPQDGPLARLFAKEGGAIQPLPASPTIGTFAQLCEREKQEQMEQEQQAQLPRMIREQAIARRLGFAVPVTFGAVAIDSWLQGGRLQAAYVAGAALLTVFLLIAC